MRAFLKGLLRRLGKDTRYALSKSALIRDADLWADRYHERTESMGKTISELSDKLNAANKKHDEERNELYGQRNRVVSLAAKLAMLHCMKVGLLHDPDEPEWPVVMIDLPNGQVSWHISRREHKFYFGFLSAYEGTWDGHDMPEKHKRIGDFACTDFTTFNESLGRRVRGQWRCHCGKLHMVNERFCTRCSKPQPSISVMDE